jgi:murein DD-endopeptidase MepM/ murein hydrolase activator NlpD
MEKNFRFSDKPTAQKIVYGAVIAILCITAVVIGILSATLNKESKVEQPPVSDNSQNTKPPAEDKPQEKPVEEKLKLSSPTAGEMVKGHSHDTPVFSDTLEEWRVHTGIDISAEDGAPVVAAADGMVSAIYDDPMLGRTVVITHSQNVKTVYSNLTVDDAAFVSVGDTVKRGDRIGTVGDTSISELAEEPHLHFEVKLGEEAVNPLDYMSDEAKRDSLGISES